MIAWAWYVDGALKPAESLTEARKAVATFDEVLTTILQASLARASVADNDDLRKMIAGIYGMNFVNMPETQWRYGYFVVMTAIAIVMIGLYIGFKRNRWL